jgi:twitching motility protein PilI
MIQEYFVIELTDSICLALPLVGIESVSRFEQKDICAIPGIPPFWLGVINHQGSLLWVLDTEQFLHLTPSGNRLSQQLTSVILTHQLQGSRRRVALLVEKLQGVITCEESEIQPVSSSLSNQLQDFCRATVTQKNKTFCLINPEALFQTLYQKSTLSVPT